MYSQFYEPCLGKKDFPLSLSIAIDILYTRNVFRSQSNFFLDQNIPSPMSERLTLHIDTIKALESLKPRFRTEIFT